MRCLSLFAIALIALRLGGAQAEEDAADAPEDDEFDLDDLEDDTDASAPAGQAGPGGQAAPAVDDFDLGMPEEDRQQRMGACFSYTLGRVQARRDMMEQTVQEMAEQHKMKKEQAMNALLFTWMMTCYMNVEDGAVKQALSKPVGTPTATPDGAEEDMFGSKPGAPQTVQQASQRQWQLLEAILNDHAKRQPEGTAGGRGPQGAGAGPLPPMDSSTGFIYVLIVFGVLFGAGALGVLRLMKADREKDDKKNEKKADKAQKKLAKKMK